MNNKHKKYAEKWIEQRIDICQEDIKKLKLSRKLLEKGKCHFRINLESLWGSEGEESIRYDAPEGQSLEKSVKIAEKLFMEKNHRTDIQANRCAWLCIDAGIDEEGMPIGERIYLKYPSEKE